MKKRNNPASWVTEFGGVYSCAIVCGFFLYLAVGAFVSWGIGHIVGTSAAITILFLGVLLGKKEKGCAG